jgi:FimV-like protein
VLDLLAVGDELTTKMFDNKGALQKYLEALTLDPANPEILWRISRAYVDIGEHFPARSEEEKAAQLSAYEKAFDFADRAVKAGPTSSMAFVRRGIANGRIALFRGVWESLDLVKQVKADLEKAIQLDSRNDVAYYVLGRTHAKVSERPMVFRWPLGLSWASLEAAIENYERAIAIKSDFIMYRLDCARAYAEMEDYQKARGHLALIGTLPTLDEDDEQFRREARELLERLREK